MTLFTNGNIIKLGGCLNLVNITKNVIFQILIVGRDGPWHIVLGEPCFANESRDHPRFTIIKDDAYDALIGHLETLVGK